MTVLKGANLDNALSGREFEGVVEQVEKQQPQKVTVTGYGGQWPRCLGQQHPHLAFIVIGVSLRCIDNFAQELDDIDGQELDGALLEIRQFAEISEQSR